MEQLDVVDSINNAGNWLVRNQALLLSYAVNIVRGDCHHHRRDDRGAYRIKRRKPRDAGASH